jgi:hypothetical protein
MKKMFILTFSLFSFLTFSQTTEQLADELFAQRETSPAKVLEAAKMYAQEAAATAGSVKVALLIKECKAYYYYATTSASDAVKIEYHQKAYQVAEGAVKVMGYEVDDVPANLPADIKETVASALYQFGANFAKWGEAKGVVNSLGNWPRLKKVMNKVVEMGMGHIEYYGALRTLGRAYFKLPFPMGSNKTSYENLKTAFDGTKVAGKNISVYGLNNLYYADILVKLDKKAEACSILKEFTAQDVQTLLPSRVPETKVDMKDAAKMILDFKC